MSSPKQVLEDSFEVDRIRLLKQINDLQQSLAPSQDDDAHLHLCRAQYNLIVERVDPSVPRVDPLVRLPSDVWIPILQDVMQDTFGYWLLHPLILLLPLTLVSIRWRKYIMEAPVLWSNIPLNDEDSGGPSSSPRVCTYLNSVISR